MAAGGTRDALLAQRAQACRLTPDRALVEFEEAVTFLHQRGMLTMTPDCSLPSLFGACHEEPHSPGKGGYGQYPKTRWWWGGALRECDGVCWTKLHKGKGLYLTLALAETVAPVCLAELERARAGAHGEDGQTLVGLLTSAGPSLVDDIKRELGWDAKRLRSARSKVERVGAVVDRHVTLDAANGGHVHTAELQLWPWGAAGDPDAALDDLGVAGVRAAVVAPEREVKRWFSWPAEVERLVAEGRLAQVDGQVTLP